MGPQGFVEVQPLQHPLLPCPVPAVAGNVDVQPEVIRLPAVLKPLFHGGQRVDCPDSSLHRRLCSQYLVYPPAPFQGPALLFDAVLRVPPVHLEVPRQNIQHGFVQSVDVRDNAHPVNLNQPRGHSLGVRRRPRHHGRVTGQRGRYDQQKVFFGNTQPGIIHPRTLR